MTTVAATPLFLSRLMLDLHSRQVRYELTQPYEMHRTLMRAFPQAVSKQTGARAQFDVLFRADVNETCQRVTVIVQSAAQPDWSELPREYVVDSPESKPFDPPFTVGQRLRFRLRANPTKKIESASKTERLAGVKKNGKRIGLFQENELVAWLLDKGQHGGFTIPGKWREENGVRIPDFRMEVIREGWVRCGKEGHRDGEIFAVRIDGLLTVTDPVVFRQTLAQGIGPAKAFGFGLLSIAPVHTGTS